MSHLGLNDLSKGEKPQSYVSNQTSHRYFASNIERFNPASHDARESVAPKDLDNVKHHEHDQYQAVTGGSRRPEFQAQEPMNPASAVSHPAAVASAAAIYPRVAIVPQHSRASGQQPHFEAYGLSSRIPPNPPPASASHHHSTPVHSSGYRHLLPHHTLLPGQYSNSSNPHIGVDVMWQQKFNPNPWLIAQYEEMRMERERAISHERERDHERIERQKEERAEKERQREWQEQERLEREERERAQREAVQQHFEESLRLALQKQQQKGVGWNPISTGKGVKGRENSPTINLPHNPPMRGAENERIRDQEKERTQAMDNHIVRQDHERWLAIVQQQRNEQAANVPHLQNFSSVEPRSVRSAKQESSQISVHGSSSKPNLTPSPISSSASQMKTETNFSLYGYQPFQHTYITHAQLKAREETKASSNIQSVRVPSNSQLKAGLSLKGDSERPLTPGSSHSGTLINPPSSKHQLKTMHPSQDRSSALMYQPLVGSGGAFKPYEYSSNSSSPAPPAHQNTSPAISGRMSTPQYQQLQDQPQNLVKGDGKAHQEKISTSHKYESRDMKQMVCTTASVHPCFSPPYGSSKSTSPAANTTYSYSLIQQGLVPNPMYIAATHSGGNTNASTPVSFVHSQASSKAPVHSGSPPVSQQYAHISPISGITSGSPVCRPSSVPYMQPGRASQNYSPSSSIPVNVNSNKMLVSQEAHLSNRAHFAVQGSSHRSPSPAHLYGAQTNPGTPNSPHRSSPRLAVSSHSSVHMPANNAMSSSPFHSSPQLENPEVTNVHSGVPLVKRKILNEEVSRKRPKSIDDGLLPPQLQPQMQMSGSDCVESQIVAPPHLVSNAPILGEHHQSADSFPAKSDPPSPIISSNLVYKHESVATPPSMPDLLGTPNPAHQDTDLDSAGTQNYINCLTKYKIPNKIIVTDSSTDETVEFSVNNYASNASDKRSAPSTGSIESTEEQSATTATTVTSCSNTPATNSSSNTSIHTKLKKAWLQRHSENEDKKIPIESNTEIKVEFPIKVEPETLDPEVTVKSEPFVPEAPAYEIIEDVKIKVLDENSESGDNRSNKSDKAVDENYSNSESDAEPESKNSKKKSKSVRKHVVIALPLNKRTKGGSSDDIIVDEQSSVKKDGKKKSVPLAKDAAISVKKRGRKAKARTIPLEDDNNTEETLFDILHKRIVNPPLLELKKSGEPFLQHGSCWRAAPRLPKCRECRWKTPKERDDMSYIFCRFFSFRKLRYGKSGALMTYGFSEPTEAKKDDFTLWVPPVEAPPEEMEVETSKFLLTHAGDQFCDLVEMEKDAQKMHMSKDVRISWKRIVQGIREMCDVCETTLFNIHWVCKKCGFVVCVDCYRSRKNGRGKEETPFKDKDEFHWVLCLNKQPHEQHKMMLTQIIAGSALSDLGKTLHDIRRKWNIPTYCNCGVKDCDQDSKNSTNGICKLMSAVTKCFSSDKDSSSREANGSDSSRLTRRSGKGSVNGLIKQEDGLGGYSSESGGSPLSWLADVALNSSTKMSDDQKEKDDEEKSSEDQESNADASVDSDDDKSENFSTLRELLIRPTGKMGGKSSGSSSSSQKTLTSTLDEVISCVIEQKVRKSDKNRKEKQLLHFTRRSQMPRSGRELPPIRTCMLAETSLLYPEIPHLWLGSGKILLLQDPYHSGNTQMFQEQWKRGQPVVIADVGKNLDPSLWTPESFLKEFGDYRIDFVDCVCGTLLPNQLMKKFWDGFDVVSKRMKGDDGEPMVLKMIDWPAGDEFAAILPTRYADLMKALPLPQYTHRNGVLNMASRLPNIFVKPDLGPRLYNAYGISSSYGKGSTNLHLDVSDAINILAYVSDGCDLKGDLVPDIMKTLDESGCDPIMKKRAKEKGYKPGAIWHVYNARDADKIRDFLNKISEEQGVKLNPHHDPIHNQEWYLDQKLRNRLYKEYGVEAYTIAQCHGDAIFIPAGSPHQVQNLYSCIIVSEDFVSPESVGQCFFLTQEIRNLSDNPLNHEDKLQIKSIIFHAVKDALALLQSRDPEGAKT